MHSVVTEIKISLWPRRIANSLKATPETKNGNSIVPSAGIRRLAFLLVKYLFGISNNSGRVIPVRLSECGQDCTYSLFIEPKGCSTDEMRERRQILVKHGIGPQACSLSRKPYRVALQTKNNMLPIQTYSQPCFKNMTWWLRKISDFSETWHTFIVLKQMKPGLATEQMV